MTFKLLEDFYSFLLKKETPTNESSIREHQPFSSTPLTCHSFVDGLAIIADFIKNQREILSQYKKAIDKVKKSLLQCNFSSRSLDLTRFAQTVFSEALNDLQDLTLQLISTTIEANLHLIPSSMRLSWRSKTSLLLLEEYGLNVIA
jgi:uncharacterized protein YozE (UPF0346 family)